MPEFYNIWIQCGIAELMYIFESLLGKKEWMRKILFGICLMLFKAHQFYLWDVLENKI